MKDEFRAKGLKEAQEKLKEETLSEEERQAYRRFQENRRIERSEIETALKEGIEKGIEQVATTAILQGKDNELISELTGLSATQLAELRKKVQG